MTWIQTYSGEAFEIPDPKPDQIQIEDIAHHLSQICRFTGATIKHYSVAQHSLLVAHEVYRETGHAIDGLCGLFHDASEAYIGDLPRPIKYEIALAEDYKRIEHNLMQHIKAKFNLPVIFSEVIGKVDRRILATERRDVMKPSKRPWAELPEPYPWKIEFWDMKRAEVLFLEAYDSLRKLAPQSSE